MKTFKTKLKLNNKQRTRLFKNAGVVRNNETEFCKEGILQKADNCSVQLETFIS